MKKLKNKTFAVLAEKTDSISHRWINIQLTFNSVSYKALGKYYIYYGKEKDWEIKSTKPIHIPVYTEKELEKLIERDKWSSINENDI